MTPSQERVAEGVRARRRIREGEARRMRIALGVTQVEAAAAVGVGHSTVSQWERGVNKPRRYAAVTYMRFLDALAAALDAGEVGR